MKSPQLDKFANILISNNAMIPAYIGMIFSFMIAGYSLHTNPIIFIFFLSVGIVLSLSLKEASILESRQ